MAAEYGRTVGGMIGMVARGGTNEYHGEALVLQANYGFANISCFEVEITDTTPELHRV